MRRCLAKTHGTGRKGASRTNGLMAVFAIRRARKGAHNRYVEKHTKSDEYDDDLDNEEETIKNHEQDDGLTSGAY